MADGSAIEWCDSTWNPITGCSIVSPGCTNCYAMRLAGTRLRNHPSRAGLTRDTKAGPVWTGEVRLNEGWLGLPLRWRKPRRIFVCAHGDLFHEAVPDEWIDRVFAVMALAPQHVFQVLTKRPERMRDYLEEGQSTLLRRWARAHPPGTVLHHSAAQIEAMLSPDATPEMRRLYRAAPLVWPLPNVWLGVSAEDQRRADERIPPLLQTPAAVRWISAEPLLGPLDLTRIDCVHDGNSGVRNALTGEFRIPGCGSISSTTLRGGRRLGWAVCGGESGPDARGSTEEVETWMRSLRDQCSAARVPFFGKQNYRKQPLPLDLLVREFPHAQ